MAFEKLKSENYQNLGGINSKISPYDNSIMEFRDISNMDFIIPGSLQQRQGTATFIIGQSFSTGVTLYPGPIGGIFEFSRLEGQSFIMFSQGTSNVQTGMFFINTGVQNYLQSPEFTPAQINGVTNTALSGLTYPINNKFSFVNFVDRLFFCNGDVFQKWSGTTFTYTSYNYSGVISSTSTIQNTSNYCLPTPQVTSFTLTAGIQGFINSGNVNWPAATLTYSFAFINERNFIGPVSQPLTVSGMSSTTGHTRTLVNIFNLVNPYVPGYGLWGASLLSLSYNPTQNAEPGSIGVFRDNGPGTNRTLLFSVPLFNGASFLGFSGILLQDDAFNNEIYPNNTGFSFTTFNYGNVIEPTCISATLVPQYIDVYNNQLMQIGFSSAPSSVQFSDIGEPESIQPENNFEVRTNDADYLTAQKNFQFNFYFFKKNSFHQLSGTDPSNFVLAQVSDQYGCLSNKAVVTYDTNHMLFLDRKGIVDFNGAFANVISSKMEPIFLAMNVNAAVGNAWGIHYKESNQVWWGIPVNGSTLINKIVVYDYLVNSWTHYDGLFPAVAGLAIADQPYFTPYIGTYSGTIAHFGASLTNDMGNSITMSLQSRWISDMGQSVEKQYRQLFINQESATGSTISWNVNFMQDYGSSFVYQNTSVYQGFQNRLEFGIPAKALSFQMIASTATDIIRLHGFSVASRYQRSV